LQPTKPTAARFSLLLLASALLLGGCEQKVQEKIYARERPTCLRISSNDLSLASQVKTLLAPYTNPQCPYRLEILSTMPSRCTNLTTPSQPHPHFVVRFELSHQGKLLYRSQISSYEPVDRGEIATLVQALKEYAAWP